MSGRGSESSYGVPFNTVVETGHGIESWLLPHLIAASWEGAPWEVTDGDLILLRYVSVRFKGNGGGGELLVQVEFY